MTQQRLKGFKERYGNTQDSNSQALESSQSKDTVKVGSEERGKHGHNKDKLPLRAAHQKGGKGSTQSHRTSKDRAINKLKLFFK